MTIEDVLRRLVGRTIVRVDGGFWDDEFRELHQAALVLDDGTRVEIGDETIQLKTAEGLDIET